jgi:long-chain acyl-CoA synthetase
VPDFDKLQEYARAQGIAFSSLDDLCRDRRVVAFLKAEVDRATPQLASYERVKKIAVLPRDFEIEKGEITPSLKVRRANVTTEYQALIDALYREDAEDGREDGGTVG